VSDDNPFERYDLDPREGIAAITQRLKELAEDARSDEEREAIRTAWEELTLHPARRQRAALNAHPETRSAIGLPPSFPRRRMAPTAAAPTEQHDVTEIAARPSLLALLGVSIPEDDESRGETATDALDRDPIL